MAYRIQHLGLGGILDQAIAIVKDHFALLFLIMLILIVPVELAINFVALANSASVPAGVSWEETVEIYQNHVSNPALTLVGALLTILYAVVLLPLSNAAVIQAVARLYLGQQTTAVEAIRHGLRRLLPLIGTSILMYLAIFGGLILLIIPGILFALWFALAQHVVVLEETAGPAALGRSRKLVRPHIGTLLVLGVIMFVITVSLALAAELIPQPHLKVVGSALVTALTTILWTAAGVVFYFSCRCAEENFDLHYLAENIGAEPVTGDEEDVAGQVAY